MKNILLLVVTFLVFSTGFSQSKSRVNYIGNLDTSLIEKKMAEGKYDTISKAKKDLILSLLKKDKEIYFTLEIDEKESVFYQNKSLSIGEKFNLSSILGGKGIIYFNSITQTILEQKEAFGESFLIESKSDSIKWQLSKETKQIGNYLCYKASTTKTIKNNKGIHKVDVIAWYYPKISLPFGPAGYNNLPGLIIELVVGKYMYSVIDMDLDIKDLNIEIPKKGKKITKKEFDQIGLEMSERFDEN